MLTQKHPIFLWWGRELVQFYNDAYRPLLGTTNHPRAMGQLGRDCFAEIWPQIEPMVNDAFDREESNMVERGLLCLDRHGFIEEAYFSYGYSPIRDESGTVAGIFVACSENTADVIGARRSELLLCLGDPHDIAPGGEWLRKHALLAQATHDLPFALIYRVDAQAGRATRVGHCGLSASDAAAPSVVLRGDGTWPVLETLRDGAARTHDITVALPVLPPWPEAPARALLLPLGDWGVLVAGPSPRLALDDAYRNFLTRVAQRLATLPEFACG